ncbi:MAG: DHA2 family efflux MFS transporter permease subunit [Ruminococcus sp.]|nr:DHA2 family efflux MFS transporter permease subunit [Ruminococcus sp.]
MEEIKNNKVIVPIKLTLSIVAACLVSFCGLITETAVNIAFPAIMNDMNITTRTVQWLTTGNLLAVACVTPLAAFLQRRFKLKNLFLFSTLCFLIGSLCAIFAPNFTILLIGRLIHGIACGVGVPLAFCIILGQVPFQKTGTYIGFGALVSAAAPALGPTYGGVATSVFGWRWIFILLIPILIITIILGLCTIKQDTETKKIPIDIVGIIEIMLTFLCLIFGFANIAGIKNAPLLVIIPFIIGIITLILFIKHCLNVENPLIDVRIFKNKVFDCHLCGFFLINCAMLGASFLLPNYMQIAISLASMTAGFMMLPGAALNAASGPIAGAILDKIGPKVPILTGTIIMTISVLLMTILGMKLSAVMIFIFYIIFGIGCGTAFGNTMTVAMMRQKPEEKPYGNTSLNTLMQFAGAVGTSACAACVSLTQNNSSDLSYESKTALGSTYGFAFLLVLCIICVILQIIGFKIYDNNSHKFF